MCCILNRFSKRTKLLWAKSLIQNLLMKMGSHKNDKLLKPCLTICLLQAMAIARSGASQQNSGIFRPMKGEENVWKL